MKQFTVKVPEGPLNSGLVVESAYIVTDDLQIVPASVSKSFDLLRSNNVVSMDEVEIDVVEVSWHQVFLEFMCDGMSAALDCSRCH